MTEPARVDPQWVGDPALSYSPMLRRAFNGAALTVAVLPIPVALLHLLPAYRIHNMFLVFYAPLICLLTLGYLLYVRDALARTMFKHLLKPLPRDSGYYPERASVRLRRLWAAVRNAILTLLPAFLLLTSFGCVMRYTTLLNRSVALASEVLTERLVPSEDVGMLTIPPPESAAKPTRLPARTTGKRAQTEDRGVAVDTTVARTEGSPAQSAVLRRRVLEVAETADIPYFVELTMLYIGSFLAALGAFVLMGLREYAKEALGLSERDVVLGRILVETE
ncbi:MAG: hypothetical protein H0V43_10230 [Gemmatimonadales bacterium]|nr:hypothetical protein [Gemmatimonadales bacterium]